MSQHRSPETDSHVNPVVIAAVITGLFGLAGVFVAGAYNGHSVGLGARPVATVTVTVTASPQAGNGAGSGTPAPTASQAAGVYWYGSVGITFPGINFDLKPATTSSNKPTNISYDGSALENSWLPSPGIVISLWTQSGTPSKSQCQTWVTTHPGTVVNNVVTGMQICIKTAQGRFGRLTIDPGETSDQLPATATIWDF